MVVSIARARTLVLTDPAVISINIQADHPAIEDLVDVVEVLGLAIGLALRRARVISSQALVVVQSISGSEPSIVRAKSLDGVAIGRVDLAHEVVGSSVDVVLNAVCALAIWIVIAGHLHQAGCWAACIGVAGRLLHGDDSQDYWVDIVLGSGALEILIVLLASGANSVIEGVNVDEDNVIETQEGRIPAVTIDSSVQPVFRTDSPSVGFLFYWYG